MDEVGLGFSDEREEYSKTQDQKSELLCRINQEVNCLSKIFKGDRCS